MNLNISDIKRTMILQIHLEYFINLSDFNNFNDDTARLEAYVLIFMASYDSQNYALYADISISVKL